MTTHNFHIVIVWATALDKRDEIISDISAQFKLIRIFKIHWDTDKFFDNYRTFYAHSLKHLNFRQFTNVINNKIKHCGADDFVAVIFEDLAPYMQLRETSSGKRLVNANVFDKKVEYRRLTGGGHRIHSSDDAWETNKDLTLLLGLNTEDFRRKYAGTEADEIYLSRNCVGVDGYESIQQLFYVLNNTIKYCVLRNHECLPDEYTVEGHGDIDLLVENKNYMTYLTLAKPVFPESFRVYSTIQIAGTDVPFDFRYVGDNYYDKPWEEQILQNRQLKKQLFYVPSDEDQFYSLLYHAYIQKHEVKADYIPKLEMYAEAIKVNFQADGKHAIALLDNYLEKKSFEYISPSDITVVYNSENLQKSRYALRYGDFIKRVDEDGANYYTYTSLVYKKRDSYIKRGTDWIIANEYRFLNQLGDYPYFPKVIDYRLEGENSLIEISRIEGCEFPQFFKKASHQKGKYLKSFLKQAIQILKVLNDKQICHRDFLPSNLIVSDDMGRCKVGLIDFGWAIHWNDEEIRYPLHLGGYYKPEHGVSDLYTLGVILLEYWADLPYVKRIATILKGEPEDYSSQKVLLNKVEKVMSMYSLSPYDQVRLFIRRHQRVQILRDKLRNFINSVR